MRTLYRRLERLSARIGSAGSRRFTLEGWCRLYWKMDQQGFRQLVSQRCPECRVFVEMFELEDAGIAARQHPIPASGFCRNEWR
jgi:hypothetical protein